MTKSQGLPFCLEVIYNIFDCMKCDNGMELMPETKAKVCGEEPSLSDKDACGCIEGYYDKTQGLNLINFMLVHIFVIILRFFVKVLFDDIKIIIFLLK